MKLYLYSILIGTFYQTTSTGIEEKHFEFWLWYKLQIRGYVHTTFDRFYVVTKFNLPSTGDLNFSKLNYDNTCAYLDNKNVCNTDSKKHMLDVMMFCKKIEPFVFYYKRLKNSYNNITHNILTNEINLILSQIPRKQKCGIITT